VILLNLTLQKILAALEKFGENRERLVPEYFEFFPLDSKLVRKELNFVARTCLATPEGVKRFLDVGCGPGNVMLVAESFGFIPAGIEYNPVLVQRAPFPRLDSYAADNGRGIYQQDAFMFKYYGEFDVVYLYCPVANHGLEVKLENIIESQLKKGALYIANTKKDNTIMANPDFEFLGAEIDLPIWRKRD
jgi:SAM-dependent methyltransferase